jgi:hypothetical protein
MMIHDNNEEFEITNVYLVVLGAVAWVLCIPDAHHDE